MHLAPGARFDSREARIPGLVLLLSVLVIGAAALSAGVGQGQQDHKPLLSPPAPTTLFEPSVLGGLEELECTPCHSAVTAEWSAGAHALAWVDTVYRESILDRRRPKACHACHIPQPLLVTGELPERLRPRDSEAADAHFGVSCVTCHQGPDGSILGPWGAQTTAHKSTLSRQHLSGVEAGDTGGSNALCSTCHSTNIGPVFGVAKDFKEAGMGERGLTCVGCHMAPIERRWANEPGDKLGSKFGADLALDESVPLRIGRSHALQTPRDPAFLRLAFGWSLTGDSGARKLVLKNQAGHRVPGIIGRAIVFQVTSLGAAGEELGTGDLNVDSFSYLPVDGAQELALAAGAVAVRIVGKHKDPRASRSEVFLELIVTE
ncbi:MAG: hypothetical protein ACI9K5_004135 [Gammaproteobacteria bacterium]|jgi:hypothetical protein